MVSSVHRSLCLALIFGGLLLMFSQFAYSGSITVKLIDQQSQPVVNSVIKLTAKNLSPLLSQKTVIIDQIDKEYVPQVVVVSQGGLVSFPNKDNIKHHVYSFSEAKQFELPLYEGTPAAPVEFDKEGVVVLGCNIHDWMRGYIYVSDSPYVALSDGKGFLTLDGLPADQYELSLWHPLLKTSISIPPLDVTATSEQILPIQIELKPDIKIRRQRGARGRRYH